ncbi:hypothetical protein [Natronoglycomyces albus]|uniref:Uncharacterized protein n=1 Tax=Natronoglycomyces albus TaxID=2811108 RepID=A0A895XHL0_9ACTN|nr:hypothetical protein [Natronoglycomyces albus]QSB04417.1 hypothetical protein JQS30_11525 [Natronoglycomyces albus]
MCPPGDDYVMEPDALNRAARQLLDLGSELRDRFRPVSSAGHDLADSADTGEFTAIARLARATDDWRSHRIPALRQHVKHAGQFLAVHAHQQVEVDEFSASMFRNLDSQLFPESTPNDLPAPTNDESVPLEAM